MSLVTVLRSQSQRLLYLPSSTDRSPVFSQAFVNFSQFNLGFQEFRNCLFPQDDHFKEIAIHEDMQTSILRLGKTSCNCKAKTGALRVAGSIATHKTLRQLIPSYVQLHGGHVAHGDGHIPLPLLYINVNTAVWHCIFLYVHK